jgi:hypothetical protein
MGSSLSDRITRFSEDNRMLEVQNQRLKREYEKLLHAYEDLGDKFKKMNIDTRLFHLECVERDIDKYNVILKGLIPCSNNEDWVKEYMSEAIEEKLERLELEKARLRVEG